MIPKNSPLWTLYIVGWMCFVIAALLNAAYVLALCLMGLACWIGMAVASCTNKCPSCGYSFIHSETEDD